MKLTIRQKTILLGTILLALLASITVIALSEKKQVTPVVYSQKELNLKQTQSAATAEIQTFLNKRNIKTPDLLTKLKAQHILKPTETD